MASSRTGEITLAGVTASVPAARRFVRSTLQTWGGDLGEEVLVDTALLIVSELATNAVLHARSAFTVRLSLDQRGRLRVEVIDGSVRRPERRRHSQAASTGRGLSLVAELASEWGVDDCPGGKSVWARLPGVLVEQPPTTPTARATRARSAGAPRAPSRADAPGVSGARATAA